MDKDMIDFIEANADLIDENEWEEVYRILLEKEVSKKIGIFTEIILSVGINPLEYLDSIPKAYLFGSTINNINIPSRITSIGNFAFSNSGIENITFEKGSKLTSIGDYAFKYASNFKSIVIPSSVTSIGFSAFYGSKNLTIYCEAESQPNGWHHNWNPSNRPVVWGYKEE